MTDDISAFCAHDSVRIEGAGTGPLAGLSFAVADAAPEARAAAKVVLRTGGGQGAVREACEMILRAKGAWTL